jgi:predicted transcriptional regulator
MGLDRHTVIEHLEDLEQMRFISTDKKKGLSTIYYMLDFADWLRDPHY